MDTFEGRVALVTGGGGGIGRELCLAFTRAGARVAAADLSLERAQETASLSGGASMAYHVDVTSRSSLATLVERVGADLGPVNLLCANAGVTPPMGPVTERSDEDWEFAFSVNMFGVAKTVDACLGHLRTTAPDAHVMITASMGGVMVRGHLPLGTYTPSKYACVGFGEELRHQFANEGIGVSLLCPGLIDTLMATHSAEARPAALGTQAPPEREGLSPRLKLIATTPDQVAAVALDGIRNNRFYIPTHNDAGIRLRDHFARIIDEVSVQGVEPGIS